MVGTAQGRLCPPYEKTAPANAGAAFHAVRKILAEDAAEIGAAVHRQHDYFGADIDAGIQVRDVLVGEADAAGRYPGADGAGRVGTVDAVDCAAEIHGAGAE